jgi:hypothetical protein
MDVEEEEEDEEVGTREIADAAPFTRALKDAISEAAALLAGSALGPVAFPIAFVFPPAFAFSIAMGFVFPIVFGLPIAFASRRVAVSVPATAAAAAAVAPRAGGAVRSA